MIFLIVFMLWFNTAQPLTLRHFCTPGAMIANHLETDVDIVEKDVLCRRICFEKRDLSRQLSEKTVEKALLQNDVEEEAANEDDEESEDDAEDIIAAAGANDALELPDYRQAEYNRLENMMARVKNDITHRKGLVESLLKEDQELLKESEKHRKGEARMNCKTVKQNWDIIQKKSHHERYCGDYIPLRMSGEFLA